MTISRLDLAGVSTVEAVELTGTTFRQLDYWERRGVLVPSITPGGRGPGIRRVYSALDVRIAAVLVRLSPRLGASLDELIPVVTAMRAEPDHDYLVIGQGGDVQTFATPAEAVDAIRPLPFATLVAVDVLLAAA